MFANRWAPVLFGAVACATCSSAQPAVDGHSFRSSDVNATGPARARELTRDREVRTDFARERGLEDARRDVLVGFPSPLDPERPPEREGSGCATGTLGQPLPLSDEEWPIYARTYNAELTTLVEAGEL